MAVPAATLNAASTVEEALRDSFATLGYHAFPVVESGRPIGLLSIEQVGRLATDRRQTTRVGEIADRDPSLIVDEDITVEDLMSRPAFRRHQRAIVICRDGTVGLISATAMSRALAARRMLNPPHDGAAPGREPVGAGPARSS